MHSLFRRPLRFAELILLVLLSLIGYVVLLYTHDRTESELFFLLFTVLFIGYLRLVSGEKNEDQYRILLFFSWVFRLLFLFSLPWLSEDVYRFIWDGAVQQLGYSPYAVTPEDIFTLHPDNILLGELYPHLNSPHYFSVYPPFSQFIFKMSVWIFPDTLAGNIFFLRFMVLLFEAGVFFLLAKLLRFYQAGYQNLLYYALNPLVVLELSGNLHLESILLFFLLLFFFFLLKNSLVMAGVSLGISVLVKLVPLFIIPLMFRKVILRDYLVFAIIVLLLLFAGTVYYYDKETYIHFSGSVDLFIHQFEFNASLFYFIKAIGMAVAGFDIIACSGTVLMALVLIFIIYRSFRKTDKLNMPLLVLQCWMVYLLCSPVVHPWYIIPVLALSVILQLKSIVLWSWLIGLSYFAYKNGIPASENYFLLVAEYLLLFVSLYRERKKWYLN